ARQFAFNDRARSAVIVAVHDGPFEKFAALTSRDELVGRDEKIVDAVLLARARRARRPRDGVAEARHLRQDAPDERALAAARRRTDDKQDAALARFRIERRGVCYDRLITQRSAPA